MYKEKTLLSKWKKAAQEKNSLVLAGLDPADFGMGRGDKGLPEEIDRLAWCADYIDAIAPHVAGIKFNFGYFQLRGDNEILAALVARAKKHGLVTVCDAKVSDIGDTNDAWFYAITQLGFDSVTIAPYAGNIEDSIARAHERGLGAFTMGIMSNPEYKTEMSLEDPDTGEHLWQQRLTRTIAGGGDGVVLGGTLDTKSSTFQTFLKMSKEHDILYLVPGIGAQGGSAETFLSSGILPEHCMISSTRELMFPQGTASTPKDQAAAAKELTEEINNVIQ